MEALGLGEHGSTDVQPARIGDDQTKALGDLGEEGRIAKLR
jgi:hypothetical protein